MLTVQATQAKARLAEFLRPAEQGKTIAITRHGKTVAHPVPAYVQERAAYDEAVERPQELRVEPKRLGIKMTMDEILTARHEGHRY